jgi:hypothetical protein
MDEVQQSVRACHFYRRECDLRMWHHRFGDHLTSFSCWLSNRFSGLFWVQPQVVEVAVTAAAIADPKPVAGQMSATWGCPSRPKGHIWKLIQALLRAQGIVCIKRQTPWQTFQPLFTSGSCVASGRSVGMGSASAQAKETRESVA